MRHHQFYVFKSGHTLPHRMSDESTESHQTAEPSPDSDISGDEDEDENEREHNMNEEEKHQTKDTHGSSENPDENNQDATTEASTLADQVAKYDEALAVEVKSLKNEYDEQRERIDELEAALKRSKADFENYKKRAKKREQQIRERATEDFVGRIVGVRDNLVRALEQDSDADIRPGVESTLDEFDRVLEDENVTLINPERGDNVDPAQHEVLMRVDADLPEGTVAEVFQQGYQMAGTVIQEAQITVSTGADITENKNENENENPDANANTDTDAMKEETNSLENESE